MMVKPVQLQEESEVFLKVDLVLNQTMAWSVQQLVDLTLISTGVLRAISDLVEQEAQG